MLETDNNGITTNSEIPAKQISDDGIKNFLSAVCDIVVYDLANNKNFKAIQLVLEKLKKDKVFSKAIENNAASLYRKMVNEVNYINKKDTDPSTIFYHLDRVKVNELDASEFCLLVSFFLPSEQRKALQDELKKYYQQGNFHLQLPQLLKRYLSDDLKKIIDSKDNQRNNIESNHNSDHYEINRIRDDDAEFEGDSELQRLYIKLLKVIRDDIVIDNNTIYKTSKEELLTLNNNFVEEMGDIQETYKSMPGWLRSELRVGFLDNLTIRGKCVIQKNDNQMLFCKLNDDNSGHKIRHNIDKIKKIINEYGLSSLNSSVEISTAKICLMNILSFFYYGLNLKFFADLFRLDMHPEDFTILFALLIGILWIIGFDPVLLPLIYCFSGVIGFMFLLADSFIYQKKFISSEDISKYNSDLKAFSIFIQNEFNNDKITRQTSNASKSEEYDKVIDRYESTNNLRISSGCCEDCKCDCPDDCCECGSCDCDCRCNCDCDAIECADVCCRGCLEGAANDPRCCGLLCLGGGLCCVACGGLLVGI